MQANSNKILEDEFNFPLKAVMYNNMEISIKAYNELLNDYSSLFNFEKSTTAKGHLLTLFVEKQFSDSSFQPTTQYSVRLEEVNKYKHKALFIETENFKFNICKTFKPNNLPSKSNYKLNYCKSNYDLDSQYSMDFTQNAPAIITPKFYGFLTYLYYMGDLEHLNIIMPDHNFEKIIGSLDLLTEATVLKNYVPEEVKEESIVSLKKQIITEQNIV